MDENCKKCSHFDEQVHLDKEDKVDILPEHLPEEMKEGERMTNLDKLLEDIKSKELIIDAIVSQFCIDKSNFKITRHITCNTCEFYEEDNRDCDNRVFAWLHEDYVEGGE